jgi:tripartite-type tricarboxylate transporter receptor subunit TctC
VRPLAVGTAKRSPSLPDVPSVAESGYPGVEASLWLGFFGPKGMSADVAKRLHTELVSIAQSAEMKEQFMRNGAESITTSPPELSRLVATEIDKYVKVIKAAGIKPQ